MSIRNRITAGLMAVTVALGLGACKDDSPTTSSPSDQAAPEFAKGSKLLKNVPVTANEVGGSRVFKGKVSITRFDATPIAGTDRGQLVVSGTLKLADGTVQQFSNVPATLANASGGGGLRILMFQGSCSILDLDIGAIHLDLLGLVVDLAPVHLDITAETGSGNLLGNLLCALVGILDPGGTGLLTQLIGLLQQINDILAGL
jgi:hypothetical protein